MSNSSVWALIPDYPHYAVSTDGRVLSIRYNRILAPTPQPGKGYSRVTLCNSAGKKKHKIARLVALAHVPNPDGKPEVNHKDGVRTNDTVENLEWVTRQENMEHAGATGLLSGWNRLPLAA